MSLQTPLSSTVTPQTGAIVPRIQTTTDVAVVSPRVQSVSRVAAVPVRETFCRSIVKECLSTHRDLNEEDVEYASSLGCRFGPDDDDLAMFALHSCKSTNTGRFSLTYNFELDRAIVGRNDQRVIDLASVKADVAWPEVFDNSDLSDAERETIMRVHDKELNAVKNVIEQGKTMSPPYTVQFMTKCEPTIDKVIDKRNGIDTKTTLYGMCYKGVCIEESRHGEVLFDLEQPEKLTETVMVPEKAASAEIGIHLVRCYDFIHLLHGLSLDPPVDPTTGQKFSDITEKTLLSRYGKEIKMYQKFIDNLKKSGVFS